MAESTGCIPGVSRKPGVSSASRKPGSVYGVSRKSFLSPGNEVVSSEMKGGKGVSCSDIPLAEMELRYQQDPKVKQDSKVKQEDPKVKQDSKVKQEDPKVKQNLFCMELPLPFPVGWEPLNCGMVRQLPEYQLKNI